MPFDVFLIKVLTTFYRRVYIVAKPVERQVEIDSAIVTAIRPLTAADAAAYAAQSARHSADEFCQQLQLGYECFALFSGERVIHTGWASTHHPYLPYPNRVLVLRPGEFYQFTTYTVPEYRSHGLATLRNTYVLRHYQQRGFTRSLASCAVENKLGLRALLSAQYDILGVFSCLRLGPLQYDWQRQLTPEPFPTLLPPP